MINITYETINNVNFKFIWRNKCQYQRKNNNMAKNYEEGGANAFDEWCTETEIVKIVY